MPPLNFRLHFQEQWKSSTHSKRRDRSDDEEGGTSEKKKRKGGKRRKKDKNSKSRYDTEEPEADAMDEQEMEDEEADMNYQEEPQALMNDDAEENAQDLLAAVGLEDSDTDDETVIYYLIGIMTFENLFCLNHTIFWLKFIFLHLTMD